MSTEAKAVALPVGVPEMAMAAELEVVMACSHCEPYAG
jgi:hypothetical protein